MEPYFEHPERLPKNVEGPFYTLGERDSDGQWWSMCLQCDLPQNEAPTLLAPLTGTNDDTYFIRQPETDAEIEQACRAMEVCCTSALRYGGHDPKIIARLRVWIATMPLGPARHPPKQCMHPKQCMQPGLGGNGGESSHPAHSQDAQSHPFRIGMSHGLTSPSNPVAANQTWQS